MTCGDCPLTGRHHAGVSGCSHAGPPASASGAPRRRCGDGGAAIVRPPCTTRTSRCASSDGGTSSPVVSGGTSACWRTSGAVWRRRGGTDCVGAGTSARWGGHSARSACRPLSSPPPASSTPSEVACRVAACYARDVPRRWRPRNRRRSSRTSGSVGGRLGHHRLYPEGDGVQRPLLRRSRFQRRLKPGVRLQVHQRGKVTLDNRSTCYGEPFTGHIAPLGRQGAINAMPAPA